MARKRSKKKGSDSTRDPSRTVAYAKRRAAFGRRAQPTPILAIERRRGQQLKWLKGRNDEFAKMLARQMATRRQGDRLGSRASLDDVTREHLAALATQDQAGLQAELMDLGEQVRDQFQLADPTFLLCWVSFWNTISPAGEYFEPTHEGLEAKVEFASGMAPAVIGSSDLPTDPGVAQALLSLIDEAFELSMHLLTAQAFAEPDPITSEIRYRSRAYSLFVRGDAYVDQGRELAMNLFDPEAEWMRKDLGYTVSDAMTIEVAITTLLEARVGTLLEAIGDSMSELRQVIRGRDAPLAVKKALGRIGKQGLLESYFIDSLAQNIKAALTFTAEDVLAASEGLELDSIDSMLASFAIEPSRDYRTPLDRSPLIDGPVIPVGERYLVPVVGMLGRDLPETLEKRVVASRPKFSVRRAKVLDNLAVEYLTSALPGSKAWTSLYYPLEDDPTSDHAECDGLVIWHDVCFVLEGKGMPLSPQSKRGDVRRVHADLARSLAHAWSQGNRVLEYLKRADPAVFYDAKRRQVVSLDPSPLSYVKVVTPTVHSLADHALYVERFADMGQDVHGSPPWAIYINDLRLVCDIVRSPGELVGYIRWRDRLQLGRKSIASDEADVFEAFLLRTQFPEVNGLVQIGSHSTDFDSYYMGTHDTDGETNKPAMFSTALVDDFVDHLVEERPSGWLVALDAVVSMSLEQLAFVDHACPILARAALASGENAAEEMFGITVVGVPNAAARAALDGRPITGSSVIVGSDRPRSPRILWAKPD